MKVPTEWSPAPGELTLGDVMAMIATGEAEFRIATKCTKVTWSNLHDNPLSVYIEWRKV